MDNLFKFKILMTSFGVLYVWSLPLLAKIGFSEPNSTSISGYIANPPATGAMGAVSFIPLTIIWEYQDIIIENTIIRKCTIVWFSNSIYYSTVVFQISYGLFLICTYGFVKNWIHTISVLSFCVSFSIHALLSMIYSYSSFMTKVILGMGLSACLGLVTFMVLDVSNIWFWVLECVGISAMFIFTPIEWLSIKKNIDDDDCYIKQGGEEMKENLIKDYV